MNFFLQLTGVLFWRYGICTPLVGQEGCEPDWTHFSGYCYQATHAHLPFNSAQTLCQKKGGTLTSLWSLEEVSFAGELLQNLEVIKPSSWIGTSVSGNKWMWLDGSGSLSDVLKGKTVADKDYCGILTPDGDIEFVRCQIPMSAFVCKKPLNRVFAPTETEMTDEGILVMRDPHEIVFEKISPPLLDKVSLSISPVNRIATLNVAQETDCAYRCYSVDECQAFVVACQTTSRCGDYRCTLLSGLELL